MFAAVSQPVRLPGYYEGEESILRRGLVYSKWKHIYEHYQGETLWILLIQTLTPQQGGGGVHL